MIDVMFSLVIAGILGDAFGSLFGLIGDFFSNIGGLIWDAISWVGGLIWDAIEWLGGILWDVITWLGDLLRNLFQGLIDIIVAFFEVIYALIDGLFYFLYMVGLLVVKVFTIFFEVGKLIISFIQGLTRTLQSLTYTPTANSGNGYSDILGNIFAAAEVLQLSAVAYVLMFVVWVGTGFAVIRILSNLRAGGGIN
ncbi:hypothetical protein [Piscibacillus halophilus]|uniref:hypothetical protein n=1 Tax=Piscibacillus halophilus TaxID=571933 RepID=UPI001FEC229B|nr:hypothetical protein [Piscibacillus halophilus]